MDRKGGESEEAQCPLLHSSRSVWATPLFSPSTRASRGMKVHRRNHNGVQYNIGLFHPKHMGKAAGDGGGFPRARDVKNPAEETENIEEVQGMTGQTIGFFFQGGDGAYSLIFMFFLFLYKEEVSDGNGGCYIKSPG